MSDRKITDQTPSPAALASAKDGYMRAAEVHEVLQIKARTLNNLVRAGHIEKTGRGTGTRYTRTSVVKYAARRLMSGL